MIHASSYIQYQNLNTFLSESSEDVDHHRMMMTLLFLVCLWNMGLIFWQLHMEMQKLLVKVTDDSQRTSLI